MEDHNHKTKTSSNVIDLKTGERHFELNQRIKMGNYKPNEELIQSTARIKKQRDVIKDRFQKMEVAKERVTKNVYDKVKRDYLLQLQTINELLDEKKGELKKEIKELYLFREKLSIEISRHREILEEAEFRLYLGEFLQNQYQEVENFETKEIEKLETELSQISQYIQTHEELFDPEDLGLSPPQPATDVTVTKTVFRPEQKQAGTTTATQPAPRQPADPSREARPTAPVTRQPEKRSPAIEPPKTTSSPVKPQTMQPEKTQSEEITIDPSEFEDLFLDDDKPETQPEPADGIDKPEAPAIEQTSSSITVDTNLPTTNSDTDYFAQEKVNEASFTMKSETLNEVINAAAAEEPEQEITEQKQVRQNADIKTESKITKPTQPEPVSTIEEDSISDILNSLPVEEQPKPKEKLAPSNNDKFDSESVYYLKLVGGEHEQKEFPLKENIAIGRSPSSDIVLKAPKVSRQHAAINMYNNQYIIIDLKSSNGVYVNGTKIDECVLNSGDEISIGGYRFIFTDKV
ncbi:MAG: hypothetical protein ACD_62C00045G0008 [uncultured bacterium]|nr:MAG: hypothetical protein ACD_62C00045G0008 [uncultured bacterium]HLD45271.1 FHA domain-containing protein [bacterium]